MRGVMWYCTIPSFNSVVPPATTHEVTAVHSLGVHLADPASGACNDRADYLELVGSWNVLSPTKILLQINFIK